MEATVNLKATPADFDRIRKALTTSRDWCREQAANADLNPADRRKAREEEAAYTDLLGRLT